MITRARIFDLQSHGSSMVTSEAIDCGGANHFSRVAKAAVEATGYVSQAEPLRRHRFNLKDAPVSCLGLVACDA